MAVPQVSLAFATDWPEVGMTSSIIRSAGNAKQWTSLIGLNGVPDSPSIQVVTAASAGFNFPTNNCVALRLPAIGAGSGGAFLGVQNEWDLPTVGSSWWERYYFVNNVGPTASDGHYHTIQSCAGGGGCCGENWVHMRNNSDPLFPMSWYVVHGVSAHIWSPPLLPKGVVHLIENEHIRVGVNEWSMQAWISNAAGEQIYGPSDFRCGNGGAHNSETLASGVTWTVGNSECLRQRGFADQGVGAIGLGSSDPARQHQYLAGFAVSLEGRIGPYVPGEAN